MATVQPKNGMRRGPEDDIAFQKLEDIVVIGEVISPQCYAGKNTYLLDEIEVTDLKKVHEAETYMFWLQGELLHGIEVYPTATAIRLRSFT